MNAFTSFNVAFPGLVGNATEISAPDMTDFATLRARDLVPARTRSRNLSTTHSPPRRRPGQAFYFNNAGGTEELPVDRFHGTATAATPLDLGTATQGRTAHPGFFWDQTGGLSFENESQIFKVPHLRNAYQKLGMYGTSRPISPTPPARSSRRSTHR